LLWRLDRQRLFSLINTKFRRRVKNVYVIQFIYICVFTLIYIGLSHIKGNEVFNAITTFIVIDISNTERKNLNHTERKHFYDTISTISRALVCGFIAPLFYIVVLGNKASIVFALLYHFSLDEELNVLGICKSLVIMIPALMAQTFLYIIYVFRNKKLKIEFKGDYVNNFYRIPLLNLDILAAFVECVNFYCYYNSNNMHYLKGYGNYAGKIDDACIKDYLSISYSICFILFTVFIFLQLL
jgi:hypothetical protein